MRPAVNKAIKHFLKTTTLHGFKYLSSPFYIDRIGWLFCCCASACCAGILCTVLWARFLQVPTLLSLLDSRMVASTKVPLVAICPSPDRLAQLFAQKMSIDECNSNVDMQSLFYYLLRGKPLSPSDLVFLEHVLSTRNLSLSEALVQVTEPCSSLLRVCRWMDEMVPCDKLFSKHTTSWGVCCIAWSSVLQEKTTSENLINNPKLDLVMQCSDESVPNGCEFFTKYSGEEWILPVTLTIGYNYRAQVTFTAIKDSNKEKLVDGNCESDPDYSRRKCLIKCKEQKCGCSDPLQSRYDKSAYLPACSVSKMNCLKSFKLIDDTCKCLRSCRKISTATSLVASRLDLLQRTYDPLFDKANATSTVLTVLVRHSGSKVFDLLYTETWWSLLSSLGGVFNMFIGVGLFSALELIFFLAERLPLAVKRAADLLSPVPQSITITAVR